MGINPGLNRLHSPDRSDLDGIYFHRGTNNVVMKKKGVVDGVRWPVAGTTSHAPVQRV